MTFRHLLAAAALALPAHAFAADAATATATVAQWRGPDRSGILPADALPDSFPEDGPKKVWSHATGIGYATPVAAGGKVYFFYLKDGSDFLEAVDLNTGASVWKQSYPNAFSNPGDFPGSRCTPVVEGDRIYTYGGNGELIARQTSDGKQIWRLDVLSETGGSNKKWGIASTPLIDGDRLYVQGGEGGNAAVAVSKADGKFVWKSQAKGGGYATPALTTAGGKRQLICFAHDTLYSLDPATGATLWEQKGPWEVEYNINASMPIVSGDKVFVTHAYKNAQGVCFQITATGATKLWGGKQVTGRFQPGVLDDGTLYVNSEGTVKAVNFADGKVLWSERANLGMGGSLLRAGDKLLMLTERGKAILARATPQKYTRLATFDAAEGKQVWASPLVADGKLIVKGETEAVCYQLK
ncbi:MAG TPA: PQQ-binding-like beta-propeller repeat protein [Tepidisphaeraceae bacterium]|nr:PQQ-binding-like beta-propeller repeat protein [Tepidisphaeraceae bacterium]